MSFAENLKELLDSKEIESLFPINESHIPIFAVRLKNKKLALNPYVFEKPSLSSISIKLLVLLFLQILCLFFTKSYSALNVIFISLIASVLSSVINVFFNSQRKISTMLVIVQGILIGMFVPENYPLFSVFTISFIILNSRVFLQNNIQSPNPS